MGLVIVSLAILMKPYATSSAVMSLPVFALMSSVSSLKSFSLAAGSRPSSSFLPKILGKKSGK